MSGRGATDRTTKGAGAGSGYSPLDALARRRRDDVPGAPALSLLARRVLVGGALAVVALSAGGAWWLTTAGSADLRDALRLRYETWILAQRASALGPPGTSIEPVRVEVLPGEPIGALADRLEQFGLIRDARAFVALAHSQGRDRRIQAGTHALRANMSADEILAALEVAEGDEVTITLSEGLRAEEVAERLAGAGLVDRAAFLALVDEPSGIMLPPIVAARPAGRSLEGYLFPDTYRFAPDAGAEAVLARLVETFAERVGGLLSAPHAPTTPSDAAAGATAAAAALEGGAWFAPDGPDGATLTSDEVVALASIVEREAALADERAMVARVYLNRLATAPYLLNADPTIQYALGFQSEPAPGTWWKQPLSYADLAMDSPYNSYTAAGLPPSPIASPGRAAIEAVLEPSAGAWQYFVADSLACDGSHVFAETYAEHLANVARVGTGDCTAP